MNYDPLSRNEISDLERLIDRVGLQRLADALADICDEKAKQVRTNWQDRHLAKAWEKASVACQKLSAAANDIP
jgi:hypothetical protein